MKKYTIISVAIIILLIVAVAGCTSSGTSNGKTITPKKVDSVVTKDANTIPSDVHELVEGKTAEGNYIIKGAVDLDGKNNVTILSNTGKLKIMINPEDNYGKYSDNSEQRGKLLSRTYHVLIEADNSVYVDFGASSALIYPDGSVGPVEWNPSVSLLNDNPTDNTEKHAHGMTFDREFQFSEKGESEAPKQMYIEVEYKMNS